MSRLAALALSVCALGLACRSPVQPPSGADGGTIYALQLCANCHGDGGAGTSLGPPLRGLERHWERDDLAEFLRDPTPWEERDARVRELADEHSADMDGYPNLSLAERQVLAEFLLGLDGAPR